MLRPRKKLVYRADLAVRIGDHAQATATLAEIRALDWTTPPASHWQPISRSQPRSNAT
jgi:hypothetical protein